MSFVLLVKILLPLWVLFSAFASLMPDRFPWRLIGRIAHPLYYCIGVVACMLVLRWPGVAYNGWLDADESTTIAQAVRSLHHPVPWVGVDTSTSGPLNAYFLAAVAGFQRPITLLDARLAGLICWIVAWVFTYLSARVLFGEWSARLGAGIAGCFVAFTTAVAFVHFSTEQLSMALLMVGVFLFVKAVYGKRGQPVREWYVVFGIFVLSAVPFAKPQGGAIAVGLVLFTLVGLLWRYPTLRSLYFIARCAVAGLALPFAVFVWVFSQPSGWGCFYNQFIRWNLMYTGSINVAGPATGLDWGRGFFVMAGLAGEFGWYIVTVFMVSLCAAVMRSARPALGGLWCVLLFILAFICVMLPNKGFPHYLCFLIFPAGLLVAMSLSHIETASLRARLFCGVCFLVPLSYLAVWSDSPYEGRSRGPLGWPDVIGDYINRQNYRAADSLAVWGWMPELFVATQLRPATNLLTGQPNIRSVVQDWHRKVFREGILKEKPRYFVDTVAPGVPYYDICRDSFEVDPFLAEIIAAHYTIRCQIATGDSNGKSGVVRIYERRD